MSGSFLKSYVIVDGWNKEQVAHLFVTVFFSLVPNKPRISPAINIVATNAENFVSPAPFLTKFHLKIQSVGRRGSATTNRNTPMPP